MNDKSAWNAVLDRIEATNGPVVPEATSLAHFVAAYALRRHAIGVHPEDIAEEAGATVEAVLLILQRKEFYRGLLWGRYAITIEAE